MRRRNSPAWYVLPHSSGSCASDEKLRIMWRMESVDTTLVMPSRDASSEASVDLPVPEVPHSSTVTEDRCSFKLQQAVAEL